jgi:HEAT repeat protein
MASVAALLKLQPGEERAAWLMLAHSFAMGVSTVFFETAASALFLGRFSSAALPWIYIAAAGVNTATGAFFAFVQRRVPFARVMVGTLAVLLASVVAFRFGLMGGEASGLLFALLVWYRVLSILTDLEYWAVATRLFDVRQAKRLFGLVGTGEVVARTVGSFSVPLLVALFGVPNLLWVSAAGMAGSLLLLPAILRPLDDAGPRGAAAPRATPKPKEFASLSRNRYLLLLFSLAFFGVLAKYFVDFAFLAGMKAHWRDTTALASFFGLFSGVTQVLSLLARIFVSGPLIGRFGIRSGLLVLPLAHAACTALLLLAGAWPAAATAVFWLVMTNQGLYKVLKHPIDNPSFKVLYQPLPAGERLSAQIAVETMVTPVTTGLAGLVMLVMSTAVPYDPVRFGWVLMITFAAWAVVAAAAGRAYVGALLRALRGRFLHHESLALQDEKSLQVLESTLRSEHPKDVLFALDLLEKTGRRGLDPVLFDLAGHASPEVRRSVLGRLERRRPAGAQALVEKRLAVETEAEVRAAAVRCFCALGGEAVVPKVEPHLADPDPRIRAAALCGLVRSGGRRGLERGRGELVRLAASADPFDREQAARVLSEIGSDVASGILPQLLDDSERPVRRAALAAAARCRDTAAWPGILASLSDRRLAGAATAALAAAGPAALQATTDAFERYRDAYVRVRLARLWGGMRDERARALLRERIAFPQQDVREAVLESLSRHGYRAAEPDAAAVRHQIGEETREAAFWAAASVGLEASDGTQLVRDALLGESRRSRERILSLVSYLYDPRAIRRARENLRHGSKPKRALALEVLDVTLDGELRPTVLALCDDLTPAERLRALDPEAKVLPPAAVLRALVLRSEALETAWTRSVATYTVARLGLVELRGAIEGLLAVPAPVPPLVRKTAAWARALLVGDVHARKEPGIQRGGRPMLTLEKAIALKTAVMFAEAPEEVLADVAMIVEEVDVAGDETVFAKGEAGDSMYLIVEGRVRVHDGDRTIITLGEREVFGELALLDPEPRLASVKTLEDTRLLRLDREAFLELMAGNIEIVRGVLHVLCERLRKLGPERRAW